MKIPWRALIVTGLAVRDATLPAGAAADSTFVADPFEDVSAWTAHPAEGVTLALASDAGERGRALRMDVSFTRGTGYGVARRAVSLDLPADYVLRFRLRGDIPPNALEFKLVDSTGNNVWWHVRRDLEFPREWRTISTRKRQIRFAWGPAGGGEIRHVAFIEIAVTAGEGGTGSVWLDELRLEPLAADSTLPRIRARASSSASGASAARAVDSDRRTAWRSAAGDSLSWIELDLGRPREFGGLDLRWAPGRHMEDYAVAISLDGVSWADVDTILGSTGGRDPLHLPESEARLVRVRALSRARTPVELSEAAIQPLEWSATPEAYFTNLAKDAPRGTYPRPYYGEQCAWAVVGPDAGHEEALLSEDGMLETGKRMYSIEPFLTVDGKLLTWADVRHSVSMSAGCSAIWIAPAIRLTITATAFPDTVDPRVRAQYLVTNLDRVARSVTLHLVARPFQVNPPWQNIGFQGGTARIHRAWRQGDVVRIDATSGFACAPGPSRFGASTLGPGELIERLRAGRFPPEEAADDARGFASAVAAFDLELGAGRSEEVVITVPLRSVAGSNLHPDRRETVFGMLPVPAPFEGLTAASPFADVAETVAAQIRWILINRDGGAIQPGSRNYDRSWIRDGSLTSSALLRMGHPEVVRDFIEWFAPFQYENGKIPCCASDRGPDPVTENDSHGQFIWLIAEYFRYTGDRALVERMWPHVAAAVAHMDSLRGDRRTAEWRSPEKRKFFGLLLPSISHEGYPNPMHSYWDNFFAYRGYVDAAYLAGVLRRKADQERYATARDTFGQDLAASIAAAMKEKGIDYVPGCAELGDFDATSTTVALTPTDAADLLPDAAIRATFERYWKFFTDRRDGKLEWDGFTPYEVRVIGSFVRLGWRDRANQALDWFMGYRNPPGWKQWAEVAYREKRAPKYIGDMPHTWVGSDFVRSVLDMLAYERGRDSTLVVGAGVPWSWIESQPLYAKTSTPVLRVSDVGTIFGPVAYSMATRGDSVEVALQPGLRIPPGGILVVPPARRPFRRATVDGKSAALTPEGGVVVRALPARVVLSP
ncbi:MAG: discoidin domain-containing protein [Candidatus Eiseniibacteriota bacterium]